MKNKNSSSLIEKQDWIPNWRDETQYQYLKDENKIRIAWEFLRRNRDYNRDFDFAKLKLIELNNQFGKKENETLINNPRTSLGFPKKPENSSYYVGQPIEWMLSESDRAIIEKSLIKWGLKSFFDPSISDQEFVDFRSDEIVVNLYNEDYVMSQQIPYGYASVLINMKQNISSQFESITEKLKWHQNEFFIKDSKPCFRPEIYKRYLRLIDALIAEEEPKQIKQILYPAEMKHPEYDAQDHYKKDKKAALLIVKESYKKLLRIF